MAILFKKYVTGGLSPNLNAGFGTMAGDLLGDPPNWDTDTKTIKTYHDLSNRYLEYAKNNYNKGNKGGAAYFLSNFELNKKRPQYELTLNPKQDYDLAVVSDSPFKVGDKEYDAGSHILPYTVGDKLQKVLIDNLGNKKANIMGVVHSVRR